MKIKTNKLTGAALDWAVAKGEGYTGIALQERTDTEWYSPSIDWSQGGPIIEREGFNRIVKNLSHGYTVSKKLAVLTEDAEDAEVVRWVHGSGPTPLIAAMRCYVASKLGDEIEIPKELTL